jgi:hypothetical protein
LLAIFQNQSIFGDGEDLAVSKVKKKSKKKRRRRMPRRMPSPEKESHKECIHMWD